MGVDIAFHIEVRHRGKWQAFVWQTPMEFESFHRKEDEGNAMTIKEIYDEYQYNVSASQRLRDMVWALMEEFYGTTGSDVRLIYCIC